MMILQVAYRNGDLVDMCNLGKVNYHFVLWSHLGIGKGKVHHYTGTEAL
jgi:hypothetical protein